MVKIDPTWLAQHCDPEVPFEVACARALMRQQAEIAQLKAVLMKHIVLYCVDDDAYDPRAEAQRIYEREMGMYAS